MIAQDLRLHAAKLECEYVLLEGMLKVVIHTASLAAAYDDRGWWLSDGNYYRYRIKKKKH